MDERVQQIVANWNPERFDPLAVVADPDRQGEYIVIGGHHRLEAARRLELPSVPIRVLSGDVNDAGDRQRLSNEAILSNYGVAENTVREQARAAGRLAASGMSTKDIAANMRIRPSAAERLLWLDQLPPGILEMAMVQPELVPAAGELGRAMSKHGMSDETVGGLFRAWQRDFQESGRMPGQFVIRQQIDDLAKAARGPEGEQAGFGGLEGFGGDVAITQFQQELATAQDQQRHRRGMQQRLTSCETLAGELGVDIDALRAAAGTTLDTLTQEEAARAQRVLALHRAEATGAVTEEPTPDAVSDAELEPPEAAPSLAPDVGGEWGRQPAMLPTDRTEQLFEAGAGGYMAESPEVQEWRDDQGQADDNRPLPGQIDMLTGEVVGEPQATDAGPGAQDPPAASQETAAVTAEVKELTETIQREATDVQGEAAALGGQGGQIERTATEALEHAERAGRLAEEAQALWEHSQALSAGEAPGPGPAPKREQPQGPKPDDGDNRPRDPRPAADTPPLSTAQETPQETPHDTARAKAKDAAWYAQQAQERAAEARAESLQAKAALERLNGQWEALQQMQAAAAAKAESIDQDPHNLSQAETYVQSSGEALDAARPHISAANAIVVSALYLTDRVSRETGSRSESVAALMGQMRSSTRERLTGRSSATGAPEAAEDRMPVSTGGGRGGRGLDPKGASAGVRVRIEQAPRPRSPKDHRTRRSVAKELFG